MPNLFDTGYTRIVIASIKMRDLFTITGCIHFALSLAGRKVSYFYSNILPLSNYEKE